jgi:hypothetical protein
MTNAMDTNPSSRRFVRTRSEILFLAASVIWAAVMIDTGASAWPIVMWITTALIPFSLYQHRTDPGEPDSPTGIPT